MTRFNSRLATSSSLLPALALFVGTVVWSQNVSAQNQTLLAEVYGRGVHAYYAGQMTDAYSYLSSAIDGGTKDPRAYYFRGIVLHKQGRTYEAEADWNQGATMEAAAGGAASVGRSLSRFQGSGRLKLETIRQNARLQAMLSQSARSDIRRAEIGLAPAAPSVTAPAVGGGFAPSSPAPAPAAPAAAIESNPFGDDSGPALSAGQPKVQSDNAMDGLDDNPFADDPVGGGEMAEGDAAGGGDLFGDSAAAPDGDDDPFGNSASPAGDDSDPFGSTGADDVFGDAPF